MPNYFKFNLIFILILILFSSCFKTKKDDNNTVPDAFANKSSYDLDISLERKSTNIVDKLFKEYLETNTELKNQIQNYDDLSFKLLQDTKNYDIFESNNATYYNTAYSLTTTMTDSVLAKILDEEIKKSYNQYIALTDTHFNLINMINSDKLSINDMITAIKIYKTLEIISTYQNNNLPALDTIQKDFNEIQIMYKSFENELKKSNSYSN